jgi:hypothetical protein
MERGQLTMRNRIPWQRLRRPVVAIVLILAVAASIILAVNYRHLAIQQNMAWRNGIDQLVSAMVRLSSGNDQEDPTQESLVYSQSGVELVNQQLAMLRLLPDGQTIIPFSFFQKTQSFLHYQTQVLKLMQDELARTGQISDDNRRRRQIINAGWQELTRVLAEENQRNSPFSPVFRQAPWQRVWTAADTVFAKMDPLPLPANEPADPAAKQTVSVGPTAYEASYPPDLKGFFQAVATPKGIVWSPVPAMTGEGLDLHPTEPFTLYLSPAAVTKLDPAGARKILALPLQMASPDGKRKLNVFLGELLAAGERVVYSVSLRSTGANQPDVSKLYAVDLNTGANTLITDYHDCGGYQFLLGINGTSVLCDQWTPNSGATDFYHRIILFDLKTGQQKEIPMREVKIEGETYTYQDNPFPMSFR